MITADEALERLREGNRRYMRGEGVGAQIFGHDNRCLVLGGQNPFAVILGCADSRVPAGIVFDQALGDLFVIRVAGAVVAESQVGSVEYAVEEFDTPLVIVMGHTNCGAIEATIQELTRPCEHRAEHLEIITDLIGPSIAPLLETELRHDPKALAAAALRAHVEASVEELRAASNFLGDRCERGELIVMGAEYSLQTGEVEFYS